MSERELTREQLDQVATKLIETGNIAAGALLFGQALSGRAFDILLASLGLLLLVLGYTSCLAMMKSKRR